MKVNSQIVYWGSKGSVQKLIQQVKIAHSFHFIILSLLMQFYGWLSKNVLKPTSKNGEKRRFNPESHFRPSLKISQSVLLNSYPRLLKDLFFVLILFITAEIMSCIHIKQ